MAAHERSDTWILLYVGVACIMWQLSDLQAILMCPCRYLSFRSFVPKQQTSFRTFEAEAKQPSHDIIVLRLCLHGRVKKNNSGQTKTEI